MNQMAPQSFSSGIENQTCKCNLQVISLTVKFTSRNEKKKKKSYF